jgi:hypothetical protein
LLASQFTFGAATPQQVAAPDVRLAAQPFALDLSKVFPWAVGPSIGAAAVTALASPTAAAASAALQTVNQVGPLAFALNSIKSASIHQTVPGTNNTLANITTMDQWLLGLTGIASTTGVIGFTEDAAQYDPFMANHAGLLQTNNQFGPAIFDLNVLKAIGFFQAPSGTVLPSGLPDNFSAVDIGRWRAGIPGLIMNTGTTGFVDYADMGPGPIQASATGGLHTTTTIGSMVFDLNVLPSVGAGIMPYNFSFTLAPDLTAANTPFAPKDPPPAGTIVPLASTIPGAPVVPAPVAPVAAPAVVSTAAISEPPPAKLEEDAPATSTARVAQTEPKEAIPGVNGAPLAQTPKTGASGGTSSDPFKPFKPFTDMIRGGLDSLAGVKPSTGGAGADSSGDSGSSGGGSGSGSGGE